MVYCRIEACGRSRARGIFSSMLRYLVAGVLIFWVVMTTLLLRVTYFPEGSMFEKVPPEMVLKMFLQQDKTSSTWLLFQHDRELGPVVIAQHRVGRRQDTGREEDDYLLRIQGTLEKGIFPSVNSSVVWRVSFLVEGLQVLRSASGQIRMPDEGRVLDFEWNLGDEMPRFSLRQGDVVMMDDKLVQPIIEQLLGDKEQRMAAGYGDGWNSLMKLTARQGTMTLSSNKRKGYVLEAVVMEQWKAKAFFTEVGELAMIDLPEGLRVVEQIIYGLAPEYPDDEEEEEANAEAM